MNNPKCLLVSLVPAGQSDEQTLIDFREARSLVETLGGEVVGLNVQSEARSHPATFLGKGKVEEVGKQAIELEAEAVIVNHALPHGQRFTLTNEIQEIAPEVQVWDRIDLILNIFDRHAATAEAKLQIKLARTRHMGPEFHGTGQELSQQAGGIGTRGIGETKTELLQRHWRTSIKSIEDQLEKVTKNRKQQMKHRKRMGMPTVSIIGYTNAGKTTLYNRLTKKDKLAKDALFATLDSSLGKMYLSDYEKSVFVSDTIGFIQDLPHELFDSFASTLLETVSAQLLLHVVDVSDNEWRKKIQVVNQVVADLDADEIPMIMVYNKIDQVPEKKLLKLREKHESDDTVWISAKTSLGIDELKELVGSKLF